MRVFANHTGAPTRSRRYSFGGTAAIVTSMGIIVGFHAATMSRSSVVLSLLLVALADNITDSLSIHVYQESEQLEQKAAFGATLTNFIARLLVASSFVVLVMLLPLRVAVFAALVWGVCLLSGLTYLVSRARGVRPLPEILKHVAVAAAVITVSRLAAAAIAAWASD